MIISPEHIVYIDVDNTLVVHHKFGTEPIGPLKLTDPYDGEVYDIWPHKSHIRLLKRLPSRGYSVILWSVAGPRWAEAVARCLKIEHLVYACVCKPSFYVDDKDCTDWMGQRVFIENWGE
jgi:hypothetical protein